MITKKQGFKKSKNMFIQFSVVASLFLGASCSEEATIEEIEQEQALNFELNTILSNTINTTIQAEDYDAQNGIQTVGGSKIGYVQNDDWIKFDDFDHSGATSVSVTASSSNSGGTIEFRKGSATGGDILATVTVTNTGGWNSFDTFSADITGSSSNSDMYVVFKGGSGYLFDVDNFSFDSESTSNGGSSTNLALDGSAEQSSTGWNGLPERAIDGNTNGAWSGSSVSHTQNESQPWWQVRLDSDTNIEEIVIWNRTDSCCSSRLSNFDVFVYNQAGTEVYKTTITDTPSPSVTINTGGVTGNRVRIKLKSTDQSLQLAEVQVFGDSTTDNSGTDDGGTDDGGTDDGGTTDHPTGSNPWNFFHNCNQWKITWIDGSEQKQLCAQSAVSDQYEVEGDALVFTVDLNSDILATTSDETDYSRSELREREEDGGSDIYWTTDGDHAMYIDEAITQKPNGKDHVVAGQIHGNKSDGIDDSMVVRLEGSHLFISFNGGELRDEVTLTNSYSLGDRFEVIFRIVNGKHYCYFSTSGGLKAAYNNENANSYLVSDGGSTTLLDLDYDETYFKVGNYCQSNQSKEEDEGTWGTSNNKCEVKVYGFDVNHTGGDFR